MTLTSLVRTGMMCGVWDDAHTVYSCLVSLKFDGSCRLKKRLHWQTLHPLLDDIACQVLRASGSPLDRAIQIQNKILKFRVGIHGFLQALVLAHVVLALLHPRHKLLPR